MRVFPDDWYTRIFLAVFGRSISRKAFDIVTAKENPESKKPLFVGCSHFCLPCYARGSHCNWRSSRYDTSSSCVSEQPSARGRDCLDHVIVLNNLHLKGNLIRYFGYYHRWRTHLFLGMDSPESRSVQPPALGKVVQLPEVGGLHNHYERLAA